MPLPQPHRRQHQHPRRCWRPRRHPRPSCSACHRWPDRCPQNQRSCHLLLIRQSPSLHHHCSWSECPPDSCRCLAQRLEDRRQAPCRSPRRSGRDRPCFQCNPHSPRPTRAILPKGLFDLALASFTHPSLTGVASIAEPDEGTMTSFFVPFSRNVSSRLIVTANVVCAAKTHIGLRFIVGQKRAGGDAEIGRRR